jgi:hypothetical protein
MGFEGKRKVKHVNTEGGWRVLMRLCKESRWSCGSHQSTRGTRSGDDALLPHYADSAMEFVLGADLIGRGHLLGLSSLKVVHYIHAHPPRHPALGSLHSQVATTRRADCRYHTSCKRIEKTRPSNTGTSIKLPHKVNGPSSRSIGVSIHLPWAPSPETKGS